jgi:carnitine-CoA ligase
VPVAGQTIGPEELIRFLIPRMTRYMIPRFVEVVDGLPKTPTLRVKKADLRARPPGHTWDRVQAGVEVPKR